MLNEGMELLEWMVTPATPAQLLSPTIVPCHGTKKCSDVWIHENVQVGMSGHGIKQQQSNASYHHYYRLGKIAT